LRAIRERGLLNILKPRAYGGLEMGPYEHAMVTLELARGCASTAWVYSLLDTDNLFVLAFPKEAQDDFWGSPEAALAGSIFLDRTKSKAGRSRNGYRLSGTFGFCSGSDHADWLVFSAMPDEDAPHVFLVPKHECEAVDDWFTLGMRGTGSRTFKVDNLFVPEHRVIPAAHIYTGGDYVSLHPTFDMLQCRNGLAGVYLLSAVAVGTALGAVEFFARTGSQQQRLTGVLTGSGNIAANEAVLARFSESAAEADLGRFRIEHGSREASIRVRDRRTPAPQDMLLESRDQSYLSSMMVRCVDRLHGMLGAKACFEGHPVARAMRDMHTIVTHVTLNWDRVAALFAKSALGIAEPGSAASNQKAEK
jgi:3-hydroxy-9,10-secoandrosta-1,3,5(10)-triene-9,17-dione monooxygenase